jgi:hypothetical protein
MPDPTPEDEDINPDDEFHGLPIQQMYYDRRPKEDDDLLEILAHMMRAINA